MRCGCLTFIILFLGCFMFWYIFQDKQPEPDPPTPPWPDSFYKEQEIPKPQIVYPDTLPESYTNKEQQLIIDGKRYRVRQLANGDQQLILIR